MTPQESFNVLTQLVEQANANAATHRTFAEALSVYESLILMSETKVPDAAG